MIAPTLDVEELDKRIADLRAVEHWLNLNAGMLRTTIQSLEVQRNTIATLRSFGSVTPVATSRAPAAASPADRAEPTAAAEKRGAVRAAKSPAGAPLPLNPMAWWSTLQEQLAKAAAAQASAGVKKAVKRASRPARPRKRSEG
jgi:hypothetical protein